MRDVLFPYACFGDDEVAIEAELIQHAGKRLVRALKAEIGPEFRDLLRVGYGEPVATLGRIGAELGPDLIVTHRPSDLRDGGLSTLAEGLLRRAHVPLLLAREVAKDAAIRSIGVACDLTLESRALIEWALRWAEPLGATVTPFAVSTTPTVGDHAGLWGEARPLSKRSRSGMEKLDVQLRSTLELEFPHKRALEERLQATELLSGDPAEVLLEAAAECDLLVVGRARPGRPAGTMGRIAHALAQRAPMHVALIPH